MADFDVDLFVIGAGSGGVRAARIAAGHGAKVMIAEEFRIGGTCVIRGCVPKKLMVYASRFKDDFDDAAGFGWSLAAAFVRLAKTRRRKGKGNLPPVRDLSRQSRQGRRRRHREPRRSRGRRMRCVCSPMAAGSARAHSRRNRRRAGARAGHSGARTCDHLERDLRSADIAKAPADRRRRLYRGRIRLDFRAARHAKSRWLRAAKTCCAVSTKTCALACATGSPHAGVELHFGLLPTGIEKTADGFHVSLTRGERARRRSGDDRDRQAPEHHGAGT